MLRKIFYFFLCFLVVSSPLFLMSAQIPDKSGRYVVVIDPGHGGHDEGASGTQHESWYNLQVALFCAEKLMADGRFEVILTRRDDTYLTVAERAVIAAEADADIIVSMHFNSIRGSDFSGVEVYSSVLDEFNPQPLCELVVQKLSAASGLQIHDLYRRPDDGGSLYYWNPEYNWDVLGDSSSGIVSDYYGIPTWAAKFGFPGIIIEHGYLSNKSDLAIIDKPDMMKLMGEADAEAIIEYFTSHTHEYESEYRVDQRVSCFSAGKKSIHCKHCCHRVGVQSAAASPDPDAHFWIAESEKQADCEHDGVAVYVCRYMQSFIEKGVEGYLPHTKTVVSPAFGHDWQVKFSQELTHTRDGIVVYECARCEKRRSDVTPAEGHSFELLSTAEPDCAHEGAQLFECTVCHARETRSVPALGHDFALVSSTPSFCTQGGEKHYECRRCGFEQVERTDVPGHDMRLLRHVDPDCENPGHDEYVCAICGFSERTELPANGHSFGEPVTIEPDCISQGIEFICCSNCGETRTLRDLPPLGHDHTVIEDFDAESDSFVYTFLCVRCGDSRTQTVPAPHVRAVPVAANVEEDDFSGAKAYPVVYAASLSAVALLSIASVRIALGKDPDAPSGEGGEAR